MSVASNPTISYYQYEVEKTVVQTVNGEKTFSSTERVQTTEPFEQTVKGLNKLRERYVLHRYLTCNQVKVFRDICETIPSIGPIFLWDFSENVKNVPKLEAQEHGYGAKNKTESDNCRPQFKCKWVFAFLKRFSSTFSIPVILYYGVEGHGKGLVDAMSSFGVKQPIRKEIVTSDFWYRNATELVSFLNKKFMDDATKIYKEIDEMDLISKQTNKFDLIEYPIDGMPKLCSCEKCINGDFDQCSDCDGILVNSGEFTSSVVEEETTSEFFHNIYNEIIVPGSFIALRSFTSFELFHVCKVIEKCVANEDCVDDNGHRVQRGESFMKCHYLCHVKEKRGIHYYKMQKGTVFIQYQQILSAHVNASEQFTIAQEDYVVICDEL